MKHLLYLLGDDIIINENFKTYIYRKYEEKFKEINELRVQSKTDKDLPFLLENLLKHYDFITLFTNPSYYATVAKILATLNDDSLVLKEQNLVPNKAEFSKDSFLCHFAHANINVIKANVNEKLPHLLGDIKLNFAYFCIFGIDEQSIILLLKTLIKSYEVDIKSTKLLDELILIKATCTRKLDGFLSSVKNLFGQKAFLGKDLIHFIASKLLEKKLKISFAESYTGGLCASTLNQFSNIKEIFEGSIISYSNRIKHKWLGLSQSILENEDKYHEHCIYFMLKGIFKTANPDFALAISHTNEQDKLGQSIHIGAMFKDGTFIKESLYLQGDKQFVQKQAVLASFCLLLKLKPEFF